MTKFTPVTFALDADTVLKFEALAHKRQMNRSQLMRELMADFIAGQRKSSQPLARPKAGQKV